ncbi:MAG: hypothetical protein J7M16_07120 [Anaerolineae bacterium]|nr:hypothetical protein [Anaerolineae bacterium]MCD6553762.1 hypothetical protein [Anaerolineae bacterium]
MNKRAFINIVLLVVAALLAGVLPANIHAQEGGPSLQVQAGFDGYYRPDDCLPLLVTVANEGREVQGEVRVIRDDSMGRRTVYAQPVLLPAHSRKQFFLYVFGEGYIPQITVRLVERGQVLRKQDVSLSAIQPGDALVGVVSSSPSTLNLLAALTTAQGGRVFVAHLSLQDLPPQGRAWGALDALVLNDVDTSVFTPAQREALAAWVTFGGHLVVAGGLSAVQTAAGVADLLPVDVTGTHTVDDVSALGEFSGTPLVDGGPTVVASCQVREGRVLVAQGDQPLLVRRQLGSGRVTYLALDLTTAPLQGWVGNEALWERLLMRDSTQRPNLGVRDGNALRGALASAAPLTLPSPWLVGCFLSFYVLIVGPLNYVILRRIKRTVWAWVTIPVCIVLFSGCAYLTGFQIRGRRVIVSQVSIIRAWAGQPIAGVDSYVALFSPRRGTYQVEVEGAPLVSRLPEAYVMGMDTSSLHVQQGDPVTVRDLRVDVGEMRGFTAQTYVTAPAIRADVRLDDSTDQVRLVGTLTNEGAVPLEDCLLALRNQTVTLGTIQPGQTVQVDEAVDFGASLFYHELVDKLASGTSLEVKSRRRQIAQAVFGYGYEGPGVALLDSGLNLVGWQEGAPLAVTVAGQSPAVRATSLWLISIPLARETGSVVIPPGFMFWEVVESDGVYNPTPYGFYLGGGSVTFRFHMGAEFSDLHVQELTLYLGCERANYGGSPTLPRVFLRDWGDGGWVQQSGLVWGANPIRDPVAYVSPEGVIEVRVVAQQYYEMLSLDFGVRGDGSAD